MSNLHVINNDGRNESCQKQKRFTDPPRSYGMGNGGGEKKLVSFEHNTGYLGSFLPVQNNKESNANSRTFPQSHQYQSPPLEGIVQVRARKRGYDTASPASVSDITCTASLQTELSNERAKSSKLEATVKAYEQMHSHTSRNAEPMETLAQSSVQHVVKTDIFPKKKFCTPTELAYTPHKRSIANLIMDKLNIIQDRRHSFWNTYKDTAYKTVIQCRTSRINRIRIKFIEDFKSDQRTGVWEG